MADEAVKWCLVTGASQGLGRGIARDLLARGWGVAALDVDADGLDSLRADTSGDGEARLLTAVVDVRERQAVVDAVAEFRAQAGPIYGLVNNAGVLKSVPAVDLAEDDWRWVVDVNLTGAFFVAQAMARLLVEDGVAGRIVNMGSITGKIPRMGEVAYCATKAGLSHLTRVMALELGTHGITVNTLSPGSADAGVLWHHFQGDPQAAQKVVEGDSGSYRLGIPMGRLTSEEDVNGAVRYLLSEEACHVTGIELYVDGGQAMF